MECSIEGLDTLALSYVPSSLHPSFASQTAGQEPDQLHRRRGLPGSSGAGGAVSNTREGSRGLASPARQGQSPGAGAGSSEQHRRQETGEVGGKAP